MHTQEEHDAAHPGMRCGNCPEEVEHRAKIIYNESEED